MKRVLVVGCGNIGFRHLQALCRVATPLDITVVEPNEAVHERILGQFDAASEAPHRFELGTELPGEAESFDLVVVATTASQRRAIVESLLSRFDVAVMILEKVLFQKDADYDAVAESLERHGVRAYVNCGRRTFDGYRDLRRELHRPVDVVVRGQRLGLASNAVHFLDLAEFLNDASVIAVDATALEPGSVPGKRADVVEIFGTMRAALDNGATLAVESLDVDPVRIEIELRSADRVIIIDELARTQSEGGEVETFVSQNVSDTFEIYADAVDHRECSLTPYADSSRQHRFYLAALRSHLDLPLDAACPVS